LKTAEIHLLYFKQGDDLQACLEGADYNIVQGLENHSEMLKYCGRHLDKIRNLIKNKYFKEIKNIKIDADCHFISIEGPDDFIDELVEKELAEIHEYEESID
jgi:hypothetical protein